MSNKTNLVEATLLALQGKLKLDEDVNIEIDDNEAVIETDDVTVIVGEEHDEEEDNEEEDNNEESTTPEETVICDGDDCVDEIFESKESDYIEKCLAKVKEELGRELTDEEIRLIKTVAPIMKKDESVIEESLKANDEDGWGDEIIEICSKFFSKSSKLEYAVKNCRRGVYAGEGTTPEELSTVFAELAELAEDISAELDSRSKALEEAETHDLSKDLFGKEGEKRNSLKQKEFDRDLQYVKDIMDGKEVIDDKYHEKLDLDTAKKWLRKDYIYINNLFAADPDEIDKMLAKDLPEIFEEKVEESAEEGDTYNYQLLDRLRSDCEYFLGNGNRHEKDLWAGNVKDQIAKMKELWNGFPEDKKPEWLSMEDIEGYEKKMTEGCTAKKESNKFSSASFNNVITSTLKESNENIATFKLTKLLKNENKLKIEGIVVNNDKSCKSICLEMNKVKEGKLFTKYEICENKEIKTESKKNEKFTMLTFNNKNVLECKYINKK